MALDSVLSLHAPDKSAAAPTDSTSVVRGQACPRRRHVNSVRLFVHAGRVSASGAAGTSPPGSSGPRPSPDGPRRRCAAPQQSRANSRAAALAAAGRCAAPAPDGGRRPVHSSGRRPCCERACPTICSSGRRPRRTAAGAGSQRGRAQQRAGIAPGCGARLASSR